MLSQVVSTESLASSSSSSSSTTSSSSSSRLCMVQRSSFWILLVSWSNRKTKDYTGK